MFDVQCTVHYSALYTVQPTSGPELHQEQRKKEIDWREDGNKILIFSLCQLKCNPLGVADDGRRVVFLYFKEIRIVKIEILIRFARL